MKLSRFNPTYDLILPLAIAIGFSAFIYWEHFDLTIRFINTVFGLGALYGILHAPKRVLPIAGFWIGLFWCYWIGFSFQYYGLGWAQWLVSLGFGIVYALFYGLLGLTNQPLYRAGLLFALTFFWPMDFNWMQPELIFVESYLGIHKWQFALILLSLASTKLLQGRKRWLPLLGILGTIQFSYPSPDLPPLKIKLISTDTPQDFKWQASSKTQLINENIAAVMEAINQKNDLIVLPESAFALYMNQQPLLMGILQELSYSIPILTGTLHTENGLHYNVAYLFDHGKVTVAKKMILVPFGEYIPLPSFLQGWVNREIFGGGADFVTADKPTDFSIKGVTFRNAICYEASREELYTSDVRYMIAMSNNGWFKPSIEPTLQTLLIRFNARKNNTIVFHSTNGGGSGVIY